MKKNVILILVILLGVLIAFYNIDIQTVDEYYLSHLEDIKPDSKTVFLSVRCDTVLKNRDKLSKELNTDEFIPKDGVVLPKTQYVLRDDDTVFAVLKRSMQYNKIQFEFQGNPIKGKSGAYIKGIHYIYEFSCGPLSGWMYKVNGAFSSGDSSSFVLKPGDYIEWVYSCDLGRDVGNNYGSEGA